MDVAHRKIRWIEYQTALQEYDFHLESTAQENAQPAHILCLDREAQRKTETT